MKNNIVIIIADRIYYALCVNTYPYFNELNPHNSPMEGIINPLFR